MTKPIYFMALRDALFERPVERVQQFNKILMDVVEDILKHIKGNSKHFSIFLNIGQNLQFWLV